MMSSFNRPRVMNDLNSSKRPQRNRRNFYPANCGLPYNIEREEGARNTTRKGQVFDDKAQPRVEQAREYDYSNRYVHTRLSPVGEVRNIQNPAEGYPKLQKLHQLKHAQTGKHVVKPYGCRVEPNQMIPTLNSWINNYKLQFDVIMIGALVENQFIQPLLCQLPLHRLCAKPGFLFIWATTQKIQELSKFLNSEECNKKFRRSEELVFVLMDKNSPYYPGNKSGVHNPNERPLFAQHQWHCWMCITGTVRRSTDNDLIHCNVDTDFSESIQSISNNTEAWPESESSQLLKLYHHISILLVVPVTPMCDYIGWMGSEGSISQTRVGLCQWIRTDIENARRTVIHAASLFCLIRKRKSGAHSENHHIFVAFLVLWVFFSLDPIARPRGVANDGSSDIPSCTIDWDGRVNSDAQAKWIRSPGHPPLRIAGVGDLTESTGLQRILVETHRILCSDQMWGISRLFASVLESLLSHGDAIDVDGVK